MTDGLDRMTSDDLLAAVNTAAGALAHTMGIVFREVAVDRLLATMPVEGNTQPYALLSGGASCVLAESLASTGAALHAGEGRVAVALDTHATHHRSVREGVLTGVATPLRLGRTIAAYQVGIFDDAGERVCTAMITCVLRDT